MKARLLLLCAVLILGAGFLFSLQGQRDQSVTQYVARNSPVEKIPLEDRASTLIFVGDIMLSRDIGRIMQEKNDWSFHFSQTADFLKSADLTFGNLENPISTGGTRVGSIYSFRADPRSVHGLIAAGFDVLSIANNHIWDYGPVAFNDTLNILKEHKISYVGGGTSFEEAHTPIVKEVNGTKIAFLAYTDLLPGFLAEEDADFAVAFPYSKHSEQLTLDIAQAEQIADIVIVSFHWGVEYETLHNAVQEKLAHLAVDSGADLIIGHHPHVIQDIEKYRDAYIAYSLGNFIFDQNFSADTRSGLVLTATIKNKKVESIKTDTVKFTGEYVPYIFAD